MCHRLLCHMLWVWLGLLHKLGCGVGLWLLHRLLLLHCDRCRLWGGMPLWNRLWCLLGCCQLSRLWG